MQTYAVVVDNTITNICIWDGVSAFNPGTDATLILLSTLPTGADIGWTLSDGAWVSPD